MDTHDQQMEFPASVVDTALPYQDSSYTTYTDNNMKHQTNLIYSSHSGHQNIEISCDPHRIAVNPQVAIVEMSKPPERNQSIQKIDFINKFYGQELLATLQKLLREEKFCDTILNLGDKHIKVHGIILSILSPFFQNSRSQIASSSSNGFSIDLPPDIHVECLKVFVSYIYTGDISVTLENLRDMYRLAKIFQIKFLNDCCESFAWQAKLENIMNHYDTSSELLAVRASLRELKLSKVDRIQDTEDLVSCYSKATDTEDLQKTMGNSKGGKKTPRQRKVVPKETKIKTEAPVKVAVPSVVDVRPPTTTILETLVVNSIEQDLTTCKSAKSHRYGTRAALAPVVTVEQKQDSVDLKPKQNPEPVLNAQKKRVSSMKRKKNPVVESVNISLDDVQKPELTDLTPVKILTNENQQSADDSQKITNNNMSFSNLPVIDSNTGSNSSEKDSSSSYVISGAENTVTKSKKAEENHNPQDDNFTIELLYKIVENELDGEIDDKMPYEGQHPKQRYKMSMENDQTYTRPPKKRMTVEMLEALTQSDNNNAETNSKDTQTPDTPVVSETSPVNNNESAEKSKNKKPAGEKTPRRRKRHSKNVDLDNVILDMEQNAECIPEGDRQYRCNLCANEFVFPKRCATHMLNTHDITEAEIMENITIGKKEVGPKTCDICGYVTKEANYYYMHYHKYFRHGVQLPKGWKPFRCDICGKECFTKFQLKDHKLIHKEENPFMCELCGQGFKSRTCLNSHVFHRHNTERKHSCEDCVKTFKTRTQLLVHRRVHTGEKPYRCPDCTYKSTTRGNMRLHLANRHKHSSDTIKSLMYQIKTLSCAFTATDDLEPKAAPAKTEKESTSPDFPISGCTVGVIEYEGQTSEQETQTSSNLERAVRLALGGHANPIIDGHQPNLNPSPTGTTNTIKSDDRIYSTQVHVDSSADLQCTGQIFENIANSTMVVNANQNSDIENSLQTGVLNTENGNIAIQVAIIGDSGQLETSNINVEQFSQLNAYQDQNQIQTVQNLVPTHGLLQQLQQQINQPNQINQQPQVQIVHLQTPQQLQEAFRTLSQADSNSLTQQVQQQITSPVQQQSVTFQMKNLSPNIQAQACNTASSQQIVVSQEAELPQQTIGTDTYVSTSDIASTLTSLPTVIAVPTEGSSEQTAVEAGQQNYDNTSALSANQYESNIMQQAYYHAFYPHGYQ